MRDQTDPPQPSSKLGELEQIVRERRFAEGLAVDLRRQFPNAPQWAEDGVLHAIHKLADRSPLLPPVKDPRKYMAAVATNFVKRHARRSTAELDEDTAGLGRSAEDEALDQYHYELLAKTVEAWQNKRIRVVTMAYLEAARDDEPLTLEEAAAVVAMTLGEEVSTSSVWRWRKRGFERLLHDLTDGENG